VGHGAHGTVRSAGPPLPRLRRCGVMAFATLLAAEPQLTLEVWHKER
jgi:hypothetical protein